MKIETAADLESVLKLCKLYSIKAIAIDNISINLFDTDTNIGLSAQPVSSTSEKIETDPTMTDEDLLFWSAQDV